MKILLGITGGIAAYKSAELLRLLLDAGFDVRVVMTSSAQAFVAPLTFQALSGHRVYTSLFDLASENAMEHIELARWADVVLIAPASANFIARLAHGNADDLLSTLCLATQSPIVIAPAMNQQMWQHPATQDNLDQLRHRHVLCFGPGEGEQACGEVGPGRLLEPNDIVSLLQTHFQIDALIGRRILITAGPTRESIDPIRYLTNRSTGAMGYALAQAAHDAGAKVTLISGPTQLNICKGVELIGVDTALQMQKAVMDKINEVDIFIGAAAVSDYRPEQASNEKIKKTDQPLSLRFVRNPDIISEVTHLDSPPFSVGFAAETQDLIKNAKQKLQQKRLDMIVANHVNEKQGFGECETSVTVLTDNEQFELEQQSKEHIAKALIRLIADQYAIPIMISSDDGTQSPIK